MQQAVGPFRCDAGEVKSNKYMKYRLCFPPQLYAQVDDVGTYLLGYNHKKEWRGSWGEHQHLVLGGEHFEGQVNLASLRTRTPAKRTRCGSLCTYSDTASPMRIWGI